MNIPKPSQVIATGVAGGISLPDPEISGLGSSLSSLSSSSLTSGSTGGGGNFGATNANISLPSALSNSNGFTNPFGETKVNENALVGKFYDLKQNSKREPLESSSDITRKVIQEFVNNGWRDKTLEDYFSPRQNLYLSKLYIPKIAATEAPAAFGCEKEVKPSQIMMRYTGTVRAPESGNYRFVGAADDILIVRFNNKKRLRSWLLDCNCRQVY
ncbi:MAG: hypothetical protein HC767_03615 [Akkermansiaceae bacterium]|nr:hypothetical protein [Akkermansiaceae bacterium]